VNIFVNKSKHSPMAGEALGPLGGGPPTLVNVLTYWWMFWLNPTPCKCMYIYVYIYIYIYTYSRPDSYWKVLNSLFSWAFEHNMQHVCKEIAKGAGHRPRTPKWRRDQARAQGLPNFWARVSGTGPTSIHIQVTNTKTWWYLVQFNAVSKKNRCLCLRTAAVL